MLLQNVLQHIQSFHSTVLLHHWVAQFQVTDWLTSEPVSITIASTRTDTSCNLSKQPQPAIVINSSMAWAQPTKCSCAPTLRTDTTMIRRHEVCQPLHSRLHGWISWLVISVSGIALRMLCCCYPTNYHTSETLQSCPHSKTTQTRDLSARRFFVDKNVCNSIWHRPAAACV